MDEPGKTNDTNNEVTPANLQSRRLAAWDFVLFRLAMAITEWWDHWSPLFDPSHPKSDRGASNDGDWRRPKVGLDEIQRLFNVFLESLETDEDFAGRFSGSGDLIQRWVMYFLNAVLVETLQPPSVSGADEPPPRPQLVRAAAVERPARPAAAEEGSGHPLYQNLMRLLIVLKEAEDGGSESKRCWTWSPVFSALASFPLIAVFLPGGGAMPVVEDIRSDQEEAKSESEEWKQPVSFENMNMKYDGPATQSKLVDELKTIMALGALPLIPVPPCHRSNTKAGAEPSRNVIPLDLAGLSWTGLDLADMSTPTDADAERYRHMKGVKNGAKKKHRWPHAILPIEERRLALVEMLNCLHADLTPCDEVAPYTPHLSLIVRDAVKKSEPTNG